MAPLPLLMWEWFLPRVGQNQVYTVHTRYFEQGKYQIYGRIQFVYRVLANSISNAWVLLYSVYSPNSTHARAISHQTIFKPTQA